ncbi:hypothetical protein R1C93_22025 [Citrobacter koseri]|uniref:hypothetical protein n=1 Tax=Citrobacter koseri TaxID=545 RepID=UPI002E31CFF1|nr:hypothetical protein [Citrobacter koseri]
MNAENINDLLVPQDICVFTRRSANFKARLQRYQQLEKALNVRDNLLQIAKRIDAPTKKLAMTFCSYKVLRQVKGIETNEPIVGPFDRKTFGNPQRLLMEFRAKYQEFHYDVAQQPEFSDLIKKIDVLASALYEHINTAWCKYTQGLRALWEVDQKLFSSLAHQEEQRKVQLRYIDLVAQFTSSTRVLPRTVDEFDTVVVLHEQLCQQREALKLDVPEEVNIFLKAVAGQGATLDMLTEDVRTWLTGEDDPSRYRIKRL